MTYSWAVAIFIAVPIAFGIAQALASLVPTRASEANRGLPRRQRPPAQGRAGEIERDASTREGEDDPGSRRVREEPPGVVETSRAIDWWKSTPTYKPAGTGASIGTAVARPGPFAQSTPSLGVRGEPTPRSGG